MVLEHVIIQFGKDIINAHEPTYVKLSEKQFDYVLRNVNSWNAFMEFLGMLNTWESGYHSSEQSIIEDENNE